MKSKFSSKNLSISCFLAERGQARDAMRRRVWCYDSNGNGGMCHRASRRDAKPSPSSSCSLLSVLG
eukprot:1158569-Pyramimonas_sp.AAC.1